MKKNFCKLVKKMPICGKIFFAGAAVAFIGFCLAWVWYAVGALVLIAGAMSMGVGSFLALVSLSKERDEWDSVISNGRLNGNGPKMDGGK